VTLLTFEKKQDTVSDTIRNKLINDFPAKSIRGGKL